MVEATALGPHVLIAVEDGHFGEHLLVHSRPQHNVPRNFRVRVRCGVKENITFSGDWNGFRTQTVDPDKVHLCPSCFGEDD